MIYESLDYILQLGMHSISFHAISKVSIWNFFYICNFYVTGRYK